MLCPLEEEHNRLQPHTTVRRSWFHPDACVPRTAVASTTRAVTQPGDLEGYTDQCRTSSKTAGDASKAGVSPLSDLRSHRTQPTTSSMVLHPAAKDCFTKGTHSQGLVCSSADNEALVTFQVGMGGGRGKTPKFACSQNRIS